MLIYKNKKWGFIMKKNYLKKIMLLMVFVSLTGCNKKGETIDNSTKPNIEATTEVTTTNEVAKIENEIKNNNYDMATDLARNYFTNTIDFIFYGKVVNGKTFNDLTTAEKEAILHDLYTVDKEITLIDPTYKEDLGSKYDDFKDFTKNTYDNVLNIIKKHMSDETYEMIGDTKDSVVNGIKDNSKSLSKRLQKDAKNWYESNFKN